MCGKTGEASSDWPAAEEHLHLVLVIHGLDRKRTDFEEIARFPLHDIGGHPMIGRKSAGGHRSKARLRRIGGRCPPGWLA
ncbi:hypothetical protein GCM10009753_66820 [Streptantibioticus ferralitis]